MPQEIMLRWQLDAEKHVKAPFGAYCQAYDDRDMTSTVEEHTIDAIDLGPTMNFQGTH